MLKEVSENLIKRFAKRKKIYLLLIVLAFILTFFTSMLQFFFLTRSKISLICTDEFGGLNLDFYRDYSFVLINGRVYECRKVISAQENAILCFISETEAGYQSYLLYDKVNQKVYLAIGSKTRNINKDECLLAGMGYAETVNMCVDMNVRECKEIK